MRAPLDSSHPAETNGRGEKERRGRRRSRGREGWRWSRRATLPTVVHRISFWSSACEQIALFVVSPRSLSLWLSMPLTLLAVVVIVVAVIVVAAAMPKAGGRPIQYADTRANTSYAPAALFTVHNNPLEAKSARPLSLLPLPLPQLLPQLLSTQQQTHVTIWQSFSITLPYDSRRTKQKQLCELRIATSPLAETALKSTRIYCTYNTIIIIQ